MDFFLVNCPSDCFYISSREIFILFKTLLLQGEQQPNLLIIILRGKIHIWRQKESTEGFLSPCTDQEPGKG